MNGNYFFITYLNFKLEGFARSDEAYELFKQLFEQKHYTNEKNIFHECME